MSKVWLKIIGTQMYLHELRGACFVSWVLEKDREYAAPFPEEDMVGWMNVLESTTGEKLTPVSIEEKNE